MRRGSGFPKGDTKMVEYESLKVFQMPLCLIETDSDGTLKAHQDVLAQVNQINHPLNIVCIAGPYRTGKSYLLTRLAGFSKGFALGSTIESETKGIWVWCRPHPFKKDQVLLLLDTEGLGDIQKGDKNNDNQILALGILLCSTFVYNVLAKLSKDDMDILSFVTEISKNITFSENMSVEDSCRNFHRVFPTFILSLRDFTLQLKYEGKEITSDEYLEKVCLKLQPEKGQKNYNNEARLRLKEYFKTRKCFTFDTPGGKNILSKLEDLEDNEISKDFIEDVKLFIDYVYKECPPKQMNNGHPVNGRRFIIMTEQYVKAIREGKVPCVQDALATLVHKENTRAVDESVRIYQSEMDTLEYPTSDSCTLSAAHKRCSQNVLDFFMKHSMYDEEGNYFNRANDQITKEYEKRRSRDEEESVKRSKEVLERMDAAIDKKVSDGCYQCSDGYKLYLEDMKKLEAEYCSRIGLGRKKADALNKYIRDTANRRQMIIEADDTLSTKEKELEAERQKEADEKRQHEAEKLNRAELERLLEEQNLHYKEACEQLKKKYEKELQYERERLKTALEQCQEEKRSLQEEGFLKEAERVNSNIEQLHNELAEYHKEGFFSLLGRAVKKLFWLA